MNLVETAAVLLGCAAVAGDLRSRSIPNWLTGGGMAAGVACGWWMGGLAGLAAAVAGAVVGFSILLVFHICGGLGGGDVKLMAAFGALLGPRDVLAAAALGAIAGGLLACAALVFRPRAAAIPYAPAIAIGAWLALWVRG
jgi:prepilin peptidase CpaA